MLPCLPAYRPVCLASLPACLLGNNLPLLLPHCLCQAYSYAKSGRDSRVQWLSFTKEYFKTREVLVSVLLLVDSSIPPQPADLQCVAWMGETQVRRMRGMVTVLVFLG